MRALKHLATRRDELVLVCFALAGTFGLWACRTGGPWRPHLRAFLFAIGLLLVAACLQSVRGGRWALLHALAALLRLGGGLALLTGAWRMLAGDGRPAPLIDYAICYLVGEALRLGLQAVELTRRTERPRRRRAARAGR